MAHRRMISFAATMLVTAAAILFGGCQSAPSSRSSEPSDPSGTFAASLSRSAAAGRPVLLVITEPGHGDPAAVVRSAQDAVSGRAIDLVHLDLAVSANRAVAARFHPVETPVLVTLTPNGLIFGRDEGTVPAGRAAERVAEVIAGGAEADAKAVALQAAVTATPNDAQARLTLADFLRSRHNAREAIQHLSAVADDVAAPTPLRVRAWVDLVRCRQWIIEPEKGRQAARRLIATLGPMSAEALAGGSLMLGVQDATAKRYPLARTEFQAAIDAAPTSTYADEARAAIARLPAGGK